MLNILFTLEKVISDQLSESSEITDWFRQLWAEWVWQVPECRIVDEKATIQANIPSIEVLETIKATLDHLDHPEIIGVWDKTTWLQYGYKNIETWVDEDWFPIYETVRDEEIEILYPFDSAKYLHFMQDIVEWDNEWNIVNTSRPTVLTQVNKWAGQIDRDIQIYW